MRINHPYATVFNPPRHPREGGDPGSIDFALPSYQFSYQQLGVPIVCQAITQGTWIPAFAGMTDWKLRADGKLRALSFPRHPREGGDPGEVSDVLKRWTCRKYALLVLALIIFTSTCFAVDPLPFENRAEEVRFQKLAAELRCLQCQNQNLADSDSALAKDLRKLVFEQMQSGKTDADIKTFLIARYGDFVIYDPPVNAQTAPLWIAPILGFAVLIGALIYRARRGKTISANAHPGDNPNHKPHQEDW